MWITLPFLVWSLIFTQVTSQCVNRNIKLRIDKSREKGCDAIDPDNVDGYTQDTGFPLTYSDQLNFNKYIANLAHSRNMSVGICMSG